MIKRSFITRDKNIVLKMYKSLVRPIIDYCSPIWNPWLQKDIRLFEGVQRRFTKLIFSTKSYSERLSLCGLTTLETRRLRYDLITTFKIIQGFIALDESKFFMRTSRISRGNCLRLGVPRCRLEARKNFLSIRVINVWNELPYEIVMAHNVLEFKIKLDK